MNKKRLAKIIEHVAEIKALLEEERECLDNQEEYFGETEAWQESDECQSDADSAMDEMTDIIMRWGGE